VFVTSASAGLLTASVSAHQPKVQPNASAQDGYPGTLCFFSKALPAMNWSQLAAAVKQMGFGGIDLTVRPEGHVSPERVVNDLPRAHAAITAAGLELPMITTALTSSDEPGAEPILSTAGKLGIPFFKPGYYQYKLIDVRRELEEAGRNFTNLATLAQRYGVQTGCHNHEQYIGAALWDMGRYIDPLETRWVGYYFDARHATAEGGAGSWKSALHLALPRLKMVAVKDCYWQKSARSWKLINCPLGEGMVDWHSIFAALARSGFRGPISLHMEYEIPGSTSAEKQDNTLAAAQKDLSFLKRRLADAYSAS
jgi:sugar phosphate isomerase/epimerase